MIWDCTEGNTEKILHRVTVQTGCVCQESFLSTPYVDIYVGVRVRVRVRVRVHVRVRVRVHVRVCVVKYQPKQLHPTTHSLSNK